MAVCARYQWTELQIPCDLHCYSPLLQVIVEEEQEQE